MEFQSLYISSTIGNGGMHDFSLLSLCSEKVNIRLGHKIFSTFYKYAEGKSSKGKMKIDFDFLCHLTHLKMEYHMYIYFSSTLKPFYFEKVLIRCL